MLLDILGFVRTKQVSIKIRITRPGHNFELVWAMLQNFGEGDSAIGRPCVYNIYGLTFITSLWISTFIIFCL